MTARAERGARCQLLLTEGQVGRIVSVLKVAAARIRDTDPAMSDTFEEDAHVIEAQSCAWF